MVHELLDTGIITHSKGPFFAPIILIRKKYGSYRICTDYQALNKVTIKDKFSVPFVDELLDELHGAKYFSKLVLNYDITKSVFRKKMSPKQLSAPTKVYMNFK